MNTSALYAFFLLMAPFSTHAGVGDFVALPQPVARPDGLSVETALQTRRSNRDLSNTALALEDVSRLLWAAQGITGPGGKRAAPSAGAIYPLKLYLVAGNVSGMERGMYEYLPEKHALERRSQADRKAELATLVGQSSLSKAAVLLLFTGVGERMARKYHDRAARFVQIEVGAATENVYLEATALKLGTVFVGGFDEGAVARALGLAAGETPAAIMPVGVPTSPNPPSHARTLRGTPSPLGPNAVQPAPPGQAQPFNPNPVTQPGLVNPQDGFEPPGNTGPVKR